MMGDCVVKYNFSPSKIQKARHKRRIFKIELEPITSKERKGKTVQNWSWEWFFLKIFSVSQNKSTWPRPETLFKGSIVSWVNKRTKHEIGLCKKSLFIYIYKVWQHATYSKKIQLNPLTLVNSCPFCCYSDDVSGVWLWPLWQLPCFTVCWLSMTWWPVSKLSSK